MDMIADAVEANSMIFLIVGGAGGFKTGIDRQRGYQQPDHRKPAVDCMCIRFWPLGISAVIRVALGSSTVAGLTTAVIIAPLIVKVRVDPSPHGTGHPGPAAYVSCETTPGFDVHGILLNLSF